MATPLSIDQFKMAISPSDRDNVRVVDWMDRLQNSTQQSGQATAARMEIMREMCRSGEVSSSVPGAGGGVRSSGSHAMDDSDDVAEDAEEGTTEEEDAEKVRSALPDVTVPIGLLANLSLDKENEKEKGRGRGRVQPGSAGAGSSGAVAKAEEDENNVVRGRDVVVPFFFFFVDDGCPGCCEQGVFQARYVYLFYRRGRLMESLD